MEPCGIDTAIGHYIGSRSALRKGGRHQWCALGTAHDLAGQGSFGYIGAMAKVFTIGYEQATSPAVLDELARAKVELLVDVRAVAASRRPGFSKRQLAAGLDERGIGYLHLQGLGTPKEGRLAARSGDAKTMLRIY
jgi:hypothetical protein